MRNVKSNVVPDFCPIEMTTLATNVRLLDLVLCSHCAWPGTQQYREEDNFIRLTCPFCQAGHEVH
jgi:hypothetical protein